MRRAPFAALSLGLAILAACGSGKASLYGQIREAAGPVEAAEVMIINPSSQEVVQKTITGSGGKFTVRGPLAPGTYVAEARHPGYQTVRQTFTYPDTSSLELTMAAQIKVQGIVRMPDKSVAPQTIITFRPEKGEKIKVVSDESGSYVAPGLDPGEYVIDATSPDSAHGYSGKMSFGPEKRVVDLEILLGEVKAAAVDGNLGVEKPTVPPGHESPVSN